MKLSELDEAPADFFRRHFTSAGKAAKPQEKEIANTNQYVFQKWQALQPTIKTIPTSNEPNVYYDLLRQHIARSLNNRVSKEQLNNIPTPDFINPTEIKNFINQGTGLYMQFKSGMTAPAAQKPAAAATPSAATNNFGAWTASPTVSYGSPMTAKFQTKAAPQAAPQIEPQAAPQAKPQARPNIQQFVSTLSKRQKQQLLTQLTAELGTPLS